MNTYGLEQVIKMWEVEQLTVEQAIGQILLLIREDRERMGEIERREASRRVSELSASRRVSEPAASRRDADERARG
jgi:hypothetical protein